MLASRWQCPQGERCSVFICGGGVRVWDRVMGPWASRSVLLVRLSSCRAHKTEYHGKVGNKPTAPKSSSARHDSTAIVRNNSQ